MKTLDLYAVMVTEEEDIEGGIVIVFDDEEMAKDYMNDMSSDPEYSDSKLYIEHTKGIILKTSKDKNNHEC